MPYRKIIFSDNQFYHIFNRSVGRVPIFDSLYALRRAFELVGYYRFNSAISFSTFKKFSKTVQEEFIEGLKSQKPIVEIIAFSLMPNHFHFLVKQNLFAGIKRFASNFQNGFAKYFNTKNDRYGSLFCSPFKAVRVESEEQLLHISRYIHLNPVTSYMIEVQNMEKYPLTSFTDYVGEKKRDFITTDYILNNKRSKSSYKEFVYNQVDYQRKLSAIKHLILK